MSPLSRTPFFRSGFQLKLFIVFTVITALASILISVLYLSSEIKEKRANARSLLNMQAHYLAESIRIPLYAENSVVLQQVVDEVIQQPEINAIIISSHDGRILAGMQRPTKDSPFSVFRETVEVRCSSLAKTLDTETGTVPPTEGSLIGTVQLERNNSDLSRAIRRLVIVTVFLTLLFWMLVSALSYLILRRVTNSFNALISGIGEIRQGALEHRIAVDSHDEPGMAARAVNALVESLQKRNEENKLLQEERIEHERQIHHTQKLESLGVMAGGIAHDFNNILQAVIGNMELALRKLPHDSDVKNYIIRAINSSHRAAHLSGLMLTYSGKGVVVKKMLNLNELVRENIELFKASALSSVTIELNLSEKLPDIFGGEAQLQQLIMNLVTNAAESISEYPGIIRLTTGVRDCTHHELDSSKLLEKPEPGRFVFLEVSDNGCGMDDEIIKRLFDPFFTTKFTGRGLGMSAVMGIIRSHAGALLLESAPGAGTSFTVLLPVSGSPQPGEKQVAARLPEHASTDQDHAMSGVALVVDDEKSVLSICSKMVTLCGFTVIKASDGRVAVTKFLEQADKIDVVLMDLTMPNMDGITAMNEIYRIRPDARVILSSGFNKDELCERISGRPPAGFIRKPYTMALLESELKRVMQTE